MKESPQVVGTDASFGFAGYDEGDFATIWEESPRTGRYQMQYLNRLLSPDSGWDLNVAHDINDDGVIAADGWYQPHDAQGNPTGDPQWKSCLLWPMRTVYAFFGASGISGVPPPNPNPDANLSVLNDYLNDPSIHYTADQQLLDFLRTFDGSHSGAACNFVKGQSPGSSLIRVFTYNCIRADRPTGAAAMQAMKEALSTPGAYVTFNGHANMGAGPAFTLDVGGLSGLMQISSRNIAAISAAEMQEEHYNFTLRPYVPGDPGNEILESGTNYTVDIVNLPRFAGAPLTGLLHVQGAGSNAYHYQSDIRSEPQDAPEIRQFALVHVSNSDLPVLRYKWFFFDACNTGRDYIEQFHHGAFFYTITLSGDFRSTKTFVEGIVNGKTPGDVAQALNHDDYDNDLINAVYEFSQ